MGAGNRRVWLVFLTIIPVLTHAVVLQVLKLPKEPIMSENLYPPCLVTHIGTDRFPAWEKTQERPVSPTRIEFFTPNGKEPQAVISYKWQSACRDRHEIEVRDVVTGLTSELYIELEAQAVAKNTRVNLTQENITLLLEQKKNDPAADELRKVAPLPSTERPFLVPVRA